MINREKKMHLAVVVVAWWPLGTWWWRGGRNGWWMDGWMDGTAAVVVGARAGEWQRYNKHGVPLQVVSTCNYE